MIGIQRRLECVRRGGEGAQGKGLKQEGKKIKGKSGTWGKKGRTLSAQKSINMTLRRLGSREQAKWVSLFRWKAWGGRGKLGGKSARAHGDFNEGEKTSAYWGRSTRNPDAEERKAFLGGSISEEYHCGKKWGKRLDGILQRGGTWAMMDREGGEKSMAFKDKLKGAIPELRWGRLLQELKKEGKRGCTANASKLPHRG